MGTATLLCGKEGTVDEVKALPAVELALHQGRIISDPGTYGAARGPSEVLPCEEISCRLEYPIPGISP